MTRTAAQFRGEPKRAEEYYQRARAHLGALFDVHAIEVAEGLRALGHYSLALADFARYSYYYSLALSICRSLRAYSSGTPPTPTPAAAAVRARHTRHAHDTHDTHAHTHTHTRHTHDTYTTHTTCECGRTHSTAHTHTDLV
jgi:hypothetical protein